MTAIWRRFLLLGDYFASYSFNYTYLESYIIIRLLYIYRINKTITLKRLLFILIFVPSFVSGQSMNITWEDDDGREFSINSHTRQFSYSMVAGDDIEYIQYSRYGPVGSVSRIGDVEIEYIQYSRYGPVGSVSRVGDVEIEYIQYSRYGPVGSVSSVGNLDIEYVQYSKYGPVGSVKGTSGSIY